MQENIDNTSGDIVLELKKTFLEDKKELQDKIIEIEAKIKQGKEYIDSLNKKDECDYNMFSPRSASRVYKDQVYEKKLEIEELEDQLRICYKKLANVTKKLDSLSKLEVSDSGKVSVVEETPEKKSSFEDVSVFLKLQEQDRQRIAADLHDSVLQNLSLVLHNLELAEKFIDYDAVRAKLELESNRRIVKETMDDIRSTIFDLRPMEFDDFGFKTTVENLLDEYKSRNNINITYEIDSFEGKQAVVLISAFRIVQELVINAIRHSGCNNIDVHILDEGSKVYIEVSDDGKGITPDDLGKENHFGLKIVRERINMLNGTFTIASVTKGSKIIVEYYL